MSPHRRRDVPYTARCVNQWDQSFSRRIICESLRKRATRRLQRGEWSLAQPAIEVFRSDCQQITAHPSERNASWMSARLSYRTRRRRKNRIPRYRRWLRHCGSNLDSGFSRKEPSGSSGDRQFRSLPKTDGTAMRLSHQHWTWTFVLPDAVGFARGQYSAPGDMPDMWASRPLASGFGPRRSAPDCPSLALCERPDTGAAVPR